jgi:4-hydroxybenzoate polyprenyltransferase
MGWLSATMAEIAGLFVEDGSLALSLIVWTALAAATIRLGLPGRLTGVIFTLGCLLILLENVRRGAERHARGRLKHRSHPRRDASKAN